MKVTAVFGDYYHATSVYDRALKKAAEGKGVNLHAWHYPNSFVPAMLGDTDMFILCKEGALPQDRNKRWINADQEVLVERYVENGGTIFGWHSGLAGYSEDSPINKLFGGRFMGHPPEHEFDIRWTGKENPFFSDSEPVTVVGEELYRHSVDPDKTLVWMEGVSEEHGTHPVGWTHSYGKGNVIAFTLAHYWKTMSLAPIVQILGNILKIAKEGSGEEG